METYTNFFSVFLGLMDFSDIVILCSRTNSCCQKNLNPILPGGGAKYVPLLFFLHNPKTAQGTKLKLSDFKDTPLRHISQVKLVRYILKCCHDNKITECTSQDLAPKKSEKSAICKDIELKFGIDTTFGPLSSKTDISLQFDLIMTSL